MLVAGVSTPREADCLSAFDLVGRGMLAVCFELDALETAGCGGPIKRDGGSASRMR
jgi:hypothetical protein